MIRFGVSAFLKMACLKSSSSTNAFEEARGWQKQWRLKADAAHTRPPRHFAPTVSGWRTMTSKSAISCLVIGPTGKL